MITYPCYVSKIIHVSKRPLVIPVPADDTAQPEVGIALRHLALMDIIWSWLYLLLLDITVQKDKPDLRKYSSSSGVKSSWPNDAWMPQWTTCRSSRALVQIMATLRLMCQWTACSFNTGRDLWICTCVVHIFLRKYKNIFTLSVICQHSDVANSWHPYCCEAQACLC